MEENTSTRSTLQIVVDDDVPQKTQPALQSTTALPAHQCIAMEDPPQSQDTIMNSRGSLQVQSQIVENSNPQLVPEKIQAALQSTTTTAPPAEEVCVDIPLDDPHQDMIINTRSSKEQTTAPLDDEDGDDVQEFLLRRVPTHIGEDSSGHLDDEDDEDDDDEDDDDIQEFIRRVPTLIREESRSRHLCEPVMLSIGPYHHNKTQYSEMERLKKCVLDRFMEKSVATDKTKDRDFYYGKIFERINKIRGYYEGVGPEEYTDEALTELILCDACFLVSYIKSKESVRLKIFKAFGNLLAIPLVVRDLWRVENQIPFFIINHLLQLRFGEDKVHEMVRLFVSRICFQDDEKLKRLPWKDEEYQPLHLLQAYQLTLWKGETAREPTAKKKVSEPEQSSGFEKWNNPNRSVTYLQAKGIYIRPSSECLQDISFISYYFFGVLHLPVFFIDKATIVLLQNVVAFELTPEGLIHEANLSSYVNFMNSLIDTSKDVKQLRERGILYSSLGSDEEVLQFFKQINPYGIEDVTIFDKVRRKINRHCKSRFKTWMADLFENYCRGPWAAVAVLAATAVLCLTAVQVYYAVHPKH